MRLKTCLLATGIAAFALFGAAPAFAADDPSAPPSPGQCYEEPTAVPAEPTEGGSEAAEPDEADGPWTQEPCEEPGTPAPAPDEESPVASPPNPGSGAPEAVPAPPVERDPNYTG
ncbi:hypothetical protein Q8791_18300 [Nocardiopsis sp. CT-R113]|uniref:Secreted protein n=1 Tax=Nocardiopsis codii TaxID=3065942 RepID=A0ABU7KAB7_9ACTN|nr:hypothetical protein [Nocardiopsis sp. CT-R113]MEE2039170.1 hypothetical protein [Nocardiopsis sp. CT-R113]